MVRSESGKELPIPEIPEIPGDITTLLRELSEASDEREQARAIERLMPQVYGELKMLARAHRVRWMGRRNSGTTSLVHEAYIKLVGDGGSFASRGHFYALASRIMRSVLVDNARRFQREKRGGGVEPLPLDESLFVSARRSRELLALDDALKDLEARKPELARIVECRCFGGLTVDETAAALEVSVASVKRRWTLARNWLYRHLAPSDSAGAAGR